jgi:hypothetical protein
MAMDNNNNVINSSSSAYQYHGSVNSCSSQQKAQLNQLSGKWLANILVKRTMKVCNSAVKWLSMTGSNESSMAI